MEIDSSRRWQELDRELDQLLELSPSQQQTQLAQIAIEDPGASDELQQLLLGMASSQSLLGRPLPEAAQQLFGPDGGLWHEDPYQPGDRIGKYRVTETIGHGGMGVVYAAERFDGQFEHQVAIKVMRRGLHSAQHRDRFLAERQLLAGFSHPHIARLFDGGLTEDGAPFLVMERIHGEPIDTYCRSRGLSHHRRIELFLEACQAVSDAHSRLVIHQDLKPANILVDEHGETKLLDFGVARLLSDGAPAAGGAQGPAAEGPLLMTPEYGAPEQLDDTPSATTGDVYSLGIVLYELLVDERPYQVPSPSPEAIRHAIFDAEPEPPSQRVRGARARQLRGDLDAIVLKAIQKRPESRYPSVEALANDLKLYLSGHPVSARRAPIAHRVHLLLRRHQAAFLLAVFLVMAILLGLLSTWSQAQRADAEREQALLEALTAQRLLGLLVELVEANDPSQARGRQLDAAELFEQVSAKVTSELRGQPEAQAELFLALGKVHVGLGRRTEAEHYLSKAVELHRNLGFFNRPPYLEGLLELATNRSARGDFESAAPVFEEIQRRLPTSLAEDDPRRAGYEQEFGNWYLATGQNQQAVEHFERCLSLARLHKSKIQEADCINDLIVAGLNEFDPAEGYRRAVALYHEAGETDAPSLLTIRKNLALAMYRVGHYEASETEYRSVLALEEQVLGPDHPSLGLTYGQLGTLLIDAGSFEAAAEAIRRSITSLKEGGHHETSIHRIAAEITHARVCIELRPERKAAERLEDLRAQVVRQLGPEHGLTALASLRAAEAVLGLGEAATALPPLRQALKVAKASSLAQQPGYLLQFHQALGAALTAVGRPAEARPYLEAARAEADRLLPSGAWRRGLLDTQLGACYLALGNPSGHDGELLIRQGTATLRAVRGPNDWRVQQALRLLAKD